MSSDRQPTQTEPTGASADPAGPSIGGTPAGGYREPAYRYDDEVSLRELYLILKRGMPLIVAAAVLAALAAAAYLWLRPPRYEAEATVVSNPTAVQLREEGTLRFEPNNAIPFATYQDLATSRATLEATLERLGDDAGDVSGFRELQGASELQQLTGPSNASATAPLTVVHRVRWDDPALAARFADAWAQTTVEQVRNTVLANLERARETTTSTIESRQRDLQEAEDAWREHLETDESGLKLRLAGLESRLTQADARIESVEREIAAASGRRLALLSQLDGPRPDDAETTDELLSVLEADGRLDADVASRLRALVAETPQGEGLAADATELLARTDLQRQTVELAGLLQEREHLATSQDRYESQAEGLRTRLAELRTQGARVERRLGTARAAYDAVAAIEPALAFVADMTPGNTRILNDAQVPTAPSGPSVPLVAAIAALVAAMLATVFVFLREAVREPAPRP